MKPMHPKVGHWETSKSSSPLTTFHSHYDDFFVVVNNTGFDFIWALVMTQNPPCFLWRCLIKSKLLQKGWRAGEGVVCWVLNVLCICWRKNCPFETQSLAFGTAFYTLFLCFLLACESFKMHSKSIQFTSHLNPCCLDAIQ